MIKMLEWWNRIFGLIFIFGGIYCVLCGYGIFPRNPKDPEKADERHKKYGTIEKIMGFVLMAYGVKDLLGL